MAERHEGHMGSSRVNSSRRYLLISPCRDEARYIRRTLDSVAAQSVPPTLWIVVDDGSTDETPAILADYARRLPYLRVVRRRDRGGRQVGPGVIEAFYAGLETVRLAGCGPDPRITLHPLHQQFEVASGEVEVHVQLAQVVKVVHAHTPSE